MAFHWLAHHPLAVFEFRYLESRTGKWVRARYKASLGEIRARYDRWQTIGPSEIRAPVKTFTPFGDRTGSAAGYAEARFAASRTCRALCR